MIKNIWHKLPIVFVLILGIESSINAPLQAQIGIDFNRGDSSGSVNLATYYRMYHDFGGIVPGEQNSLHLGLNGFFWLNSKLSTHFSLGVGLPLLETENLSNMAKQVQYFYEGEFALRIALLKASVVAMMLGVLIDSSEGHVGSGFLFSQDAVNAYLQASLGLEFEVVFALALDYLLYLRLQVPMSTYNAIAGQNLQWSFYPRQGSLELAFLFHKGPSFGLSHAARNVYFGPFYRFDVRILDLAPSALILSHTIGLTYYIKPPFS